MAVVIIVLCINTCLRFFVLTQIYYDIIYYSIILYRYYMKASTSSVKIKWTRNVIFRYCDETIISISYIYVLFTCNVRIVTVFSARRRPRRRSFPGIVVMWANRKRIHLNKIWHYRSTRAANTLDIRNIIILLCTDLLCTSCPTTTATSPLMRARVTTYNDIDSRHSI